MFIFLTSYDVFKSNGIVEKYPHESSMKQTKKNAFTLTLEATKGIATSPRYRTTFF